MAINISVGKAKKLEVAVVAPPLIVHLKRYNEKRVYKNILDKGLIRCRFKKNINTFEMDFMTNTNSLLLSLLNDMLTNSVVDEEAS